MWVYISACSKICPLKQLKYYLALAKISKNSEEFIFRGLSRGKKFSLRTKNKAISYSRIRENFIKVLKAVNLDWRKCMYVFTYVFICHRLLKCNYIHTSLLKVLLIKIIVSVM